MDQDLSVLIEDTDVHRSGMEIDAAVESVLVSVESHEASSLGKGLSSDKHIFFGMLGRRPQ